MAFNASGPKGASNRRSKSSGKHRNRAHTVSNAKGLAMPESKSPRARRAARAARKKARLEKEEKESEAVPKVTKADEDSDEGFVTPESSIDEALTGDLVFVTNGENAGGEEKGKQRMVELDAALYETRLPSVFMKETLEAAVESKSAATAPLLHLGPSGVHVDRGDAGSLRSKASRRSRMSDSAPLEPFITPNIKGTLNERYQAAIEQSEILPERNQYISDVWTEFKEKATLYAQAIIIERYQAGGTREMPMKSEDGVFFDCDDITCTFVDDTRVDNGAWIHGGPEPNLERALKAAANELVAYNYVVTANIEGLSCPLLCLVRYMGLRVIAKAKMPIDKSSIVYGSPNQGFTIINRDHKAERLMIRLGKELRLLKHKVKDTSIVGPGDLSIYKGTDKRYYLTNIARMMPPEASMRYIARYPHAIFSRVLRPELLQWNGQPMSSDCFSSFQKWDAHREKHDKAALDLTSRLYSRVIPEHAQRIEIQTNLLSKKLNIFGGMHQYGMNIRHLGQLKHHTTTKKVQTTLLFLMALRVIKSKAAKELREIVLKKPDPVKSKAVIVENFNLITFDRNAIDYWQKAGKNEILSYFGDIALTRRENGKKFDVWQSFPNKEKEYGIHYLQKALGVKLRQDVAHDLSVGLEATGSFKFFTRDIETFVPTFKTLVTIQTAVGLSLLEEGIRPKTMANVGVRHLTDASEALDISWQLASNHRLTWYCAGIASYEAGIRGGDPKGHELMVALFHMERYMKATRFQTVVAMRIAIALLIVHSINKTDKSTARLKLSKDIFARLYAKKPRSSAKMLVGHIEVYLLALSRRVGVDTTYASYTKSHNNIYNVLQTMPLRAKDLKGFEIYVKNILDHRTVQSS